MSGRTLTQLAVDDYIYQDPLQASNLIWLQSDGQRFEQRLFQNMEESARHFAYCADLDSWYIHGQHDGVLGEFMQLYRPFFWSAAAVLHEPRNSTCQDMAHRCNDPEARMLRQVCGRTCGCADPRSYPIYKVPSKGCSDNCLGQAADPEQPVCTDIENGAMWKEIWDGYPNVLSTEMGVELDVDSGVAGIGGCLRHLMADGYCMTTQSSL